MTTTAGSGADTDDPLAGTRPVRRDDGPRLVTRANLPLVAGVLALVTLAALENRAVGTVLPTVLTELRSLPSFGLVSAAPLASYLVALAYSGWWSDRSGPVPTLVSGMAAFAVAQLLVACATSVPVLVAGRLLSGLAEGMLDVALIVLVAGALDERLRPRMMALFAVAWILPSVLGPLVVGLVTQWVGWRWVFLGAVVLIVPVWLALRPAMERARRPRGAVVELGAGRSLRAVLPWAVLAAVALVALNLGSEAATSSPVTASAAVVLATGALVASARRLLPAGTFRATCGIGAIVALRSAVSAAFMGIGGFLPLLLTTLHHFAPAAAGVTLSITGVTWWAGSTVQSRLSGRPALLLRLGFAALTIGLALSTLLAVTRVPVAVGLGGWAVAGLGIGMTTSTLSVLTMAVSDETTQGHHNSGAQMAAGMAGAVFFAGAGAVLALAGRPEPLVFAVIGAAAVAVSLAGLVGTRRALCAVAP